MRTRSGELRFSIASFFFSPSNLAGRLTGTAGVLARTRCDQDRAIQWVQARTPAVPVLQKVELVQLVRRGKKCNDHALPLVITSSQSVTRAGRFVAKTKLMNLWELD